jgi:hypothetical protein
VEHGRLFGDFQTDRVARPHQNLGGSILRDAHQTVAVDREQLIAGLQTPVDIGRSSCSNEKVPSLTFRFHFQLKHTRGQTFDDGFDVDAKLLLTSAPGGHDAQAHRIAGLA